MTEIKIERKPGEQRLKELGIADCGLRISEYTDNRKFFLKSEIRNLQSTIITNILTIKTLATSELYGEIQR